MTMLNGKDENNISATLLNQEQRYRQPASVTRLMENRQGDDEELSAIIDSEKGKMSYD